MSIYRPTSSCTRGSNRAAYPFLDGQIQLSSNHDQYETHPIFLWRFYNGRASVELIIKELKGDYPLEKIPSKHYAANEAYFHILLFSYNLINWFKRLCLPKEFHNMTLNTLRHRFLIIPGVLTRTNNSPLLKLPSKYLYQNTFENALKKIEKLNS